MIVWPRSGVGSSTSHGLTEWTGMLALGNQGKIIGDIGAGTKPCIGSDTDAGSEYLCQHIVLNCILTSGTRCMFKVL